MKFNKIDPLPHFPPYGSDLMISLGLKGLHCGSGANLKSACLNTDSMTLEDQRGHTSQAGKICLVDDSLFYLQYDATKPFPIGNQAFNWIYPESSF